MEEYHSTKPPAFLTASQQPTAVRQPGYLTALVTRLEDQVVRLGSLRALTYELASSLEGPSPPQAEAENPAPTLGAPALVPRFEAAVDTLELEVATLTGFLHELRDRVI